MQQGKATIYLIILLYLIILFWDKDQDTLIEQPFMVYFHANVELASIANNRSKNHEYNIE